MKVRISKAPTPARNLVDNHSHGQMAERPTSIRQRVQYYRISVFGFGPRFWGRSFSPGARFHVFPPFGRTDGAADALGLAERG